MGDSLCLHASDCLTTPQSSELTRQTGARCPLPFPPLPILSFPPLRSHSLRLAWSTRRSIRLYSPSADAHLRRARPLYRSRSFRFYHLVAPPTFLTKSCWPQAFLDDAYLERLLEIS